MFERNLVSIPYHKAGERLAQVFAVYPFFIFCTICPGKKREVRARASALAHTSLFIDLGPLAAHRKKNP
jgi:hypothetical protein